MEVAFHKTDLGQEEITAMNEVIHSGWVVAGEQTRLFEEEFSTYISPPGEKYYCIYTNSCTSALKMAYKGIREGVKGMMPVWFEHPENTFSATYAAAEETPHCHAIPYRKWAPSFGECFRVNVHYGGVKDETPCTIEDSAHRIEPNDSLVGKIRCYSFYATKNISTIQGGMFVTNDKGIYDRARLFWRDGLTTSTADRLAGFTGYTVEALAGGYDGNDVFAAAGRVQLRKLPQFTKRRNELVRRYNAAFKQEWQGNHLYPFMVNDEAEVYRVIEYLQKKGISCSHHYPNTGWNGVSLPLYPLLTNEEQQYIIDNVLEYAQGV